MKITGVRTICLSRMHERERQWVTARYRTIKADCAIVVIETDEGLTGIGEACAYGWPRTIESWVAWFAPTLLGRDPRDRAIVPHPDHGTLRPYSCAVAGIDCALWDLRGKIAGKRVAELLTPDPVDRVRVYASSGCRYDWRERPEQLIEEALALIDAGFSAYKFRIGTECAWDGVTTGRFLGLVRELAGAVGGRIELMLDGNQRLNRAVDLPITGGEQFASLQQFRPYLERGAYGIVQPDAGICGITECFAIAEMADRYGVDCCPRSWHNGLMALANGHLVAALPRPRVLEVCQLQGPLQWAILADPPALTDGYLALPDTPGLGATLAPDLEARFPYIEEHYAVEVERYPRADGQAVAAIAR